MGPQGAPALETALRQPLSTSGLAPGAAAETRTQRAGLCGFPHKAICQRG